MSSRYWEGRWIPADNSAVGGKLQLGGAVLIVVVTVGLGGLWWAALLKAAAAAVQKGFAEGTTESQKQHRCNRGLAEQHHLTHQMQDIQRATRHTCSHVHRYDVADVLWNDAKSV